jgi:hypothetical protein
LLATFWALTFEFGFSFILLFCTLLLQVFLNGKHTQSNKGSRGRTFYSPTFDNFVSCLLLWSLVLFHSFNSFILCLAVVSFYWLKAHTKQWRFKGKNNLLLVALCLGSLTLEFGSISLFEFFCFAPCLNRLSWFKILGKLIHDSTLWRVDNFLVYYLVLVFHGVLVGYLGLSLKYRMSRFPFMFCARHITFHIQS